MKTVIAFLLCLGIVSCALGCGSILGIDPGVAIDASSDSTAVVVNGEGGMGGPADGEEDGATPADTGHFHTGTDNDAGDDAATDGGVGQ